MLLLYIGRYRQSSGIHAILRPLQEDGLITIFLRWAVEGHQGLITWRCAIDLDFDPKGRVRYALLIVLAILISIGLGLIVMAPALFPGPKEPTVPAMPPMSVTGRSAADWVAKASGEKWAVARFFVGVLIVEVAWVVVVRFRNRKGGGR